MIDRKTTFRLGDDLPPEVDLSRTVTPINRDTIAWTVCASDPHWNHVAVMHEQWSEERGHWVPVPGGQVRLIVTSKVGDGERHPELDGSLHPDPASAMRTAWDAGLLEVIVWPPRD
jgi:hypothetical protein